MKKIILLSLAALILLSACKFSEPKDNRPLVLCTTSILGDVTRHILASLEDSIAVKSLMGPGIDPHLYKASQGDVELLSRADLVIYNGLHLEGKMTGILAGLRNTAVLAAAEAVPPSQLINATDYPGAYDPHLWFDPLLWEYAVVAISESLVQQWPQYRAQIEENSKDYRRALRFLHRDILMLWAEIPYEQRVLITAHDAFKYYGRAYEVEVRGLQGISTTAEFGIKDVSQLAAFAQARGVKAIFVENSVAPRALEAVLAAARENGHRLELGGELYSDALGDEGSGAESYLKMLKKNSETIVNALR